MNRVVYFIQAGEGGPVKIGYATDMKKRLKLLQTGCPALLSVLATVDGGPEVEQIFHHNLRKHKLRGEWFNPTDEVLAAARNAVLGVIPHPEPPPTVADGFSYVHNLFELARVRVRCWGWSIERLAQEADLHVSDLDWLREESGKDFVTLTAIVALERFFRREKAEVSA